MSRQSGQATVLVVGAMAVGVGLVTIAAAFCIGAVARAHAQRVADEVALIVAAHADHRVLDLPAARRLAAAIARREDVRLERLDSTATGVDVAVVTASRSFTLPAAIGGHRLVVAGAASATAESGPGGSHLVR